MTSLWNDGSVDCPMCGACRSFTIDPEDGSQGYCEIEKVFHVIKWDTVICDTCGRETLRALTEQRLNAGGRLAVVCKRHGQNVKTA
jgi:hypothetical protein